MDITSPIFGIIGVIGLDTIFVIGLTIDWFKKNNAFDNFFPEWKYTRKKYVWAVIWFICIYFNVGIMCIGFALEDTLSNRWILYMSSIFGYYLLLGFIYLIVKHNIRHYYDKKIEEYRERRIEEMRQEEEEKQKQQNVTADTTDTTDTIESDIDKSEE